MPPNAAKTIFVRARRFPPGRGPLTLPSDVSEEQLSNTFAEAGPVSNVEIKFDPQTGRSKGYAFVQFYGESDVPAPLTGRPGNGHVGGAKPSRRPCEREEPARGAVDGRAWAEEGWGWGWARGGPGANGPGAGGPGGGGRGRPGGAGGYGRQSHDETPPPRGQMPMDQGYRRPFDEPMGGRPPVDLASLPPGQDPLPGQKATDAISKTLAAISPGQMQDVMASMKARLLLSSKPQLAYALFQAMLLMNIVDPSRIQPIPPNANANAYPPSNNAYPPFPPAQAPPSYPPYPPAPNAGAAYARPPPPPQPAPQPAAPGLGMAGLPPQAQAALATLPQDQQLTPDQIAALDATQKASIMQLFLGA
ncbi:hypothetical protein IAU60_001932 [Kwoniella sp. DSM 27419]